MMNCLKTDRLLFVVVASFLTSFISALFICSLADAADKRTRALKNEAKRFYWGSGVDQDYAKALRLYEKAAAGGDFEASYIAGGMYYKGLGTPKDLKKAFAYLDFAASHGKSSPESNRVLAELYIVGRVVPQNYAKAASLYRQSADMGDREAQLELGFLYFTGRGVEQDYEKAFKWFEMAALNNDSLAQYNLGIMWYTGNGTKESDMEHAHAWFSLAAANNYPDAISARNYLATIMSQEEINRAQQIAGTIYERIRMQKQAPAK